MKSIFDSFWKLLNVISSIQSYFIARIIFLINHTKWNKSWHFIGVPKLLKHRKSTIDIGVNLQLRSTTISNPLGVNHPVIICTWREGSSIKIGNDFGMTGGTIVAAKKINIGNNVNVGANTIICDTDFHPVDNDQRSKFPQDGLADNVVIQDNVFIGMNCLILKGVTIGEGSVIGAGSVVTKSIPAGVIAAGNPARVIRKVCSEDK